MQHISRHYPLLEAIVHILHRNILGLDAGDSSIFRWRCSGAQSARSGNSATAGRRWRRTPARLGSGHSAATTRICADPDAGRRRLRLVRGTGGPTRANGDRFRQLVPSCGNTEDLAKMYAAWRRRAPQHRRDEEGSRVGAAEAVGAALGRDRLSRWL